MRRKIPDLSITSNLLQRYRSGDLRPVDTIRNVIERIEKIGTKRGAVFTSTVSKDSLIEWALEVEAKMDPVTSPLYGVPFVVKDNIDVEGFVTTNALPPEGQSPASESSPVVSALLDAGAILVGKTNMDQLATGLVGMRSPYFGETYNSFSPDHISGGSSSGSAVAVASGFASFSLGTDTAGSGRVPASFNNIFGYKPSLGLLSTRGVRPACISLDCVSIFGLTLEDTRYVAHQAAFFDEKHPYSRHLRSGPRSFDKQSKLRIAIPSSPYFAGDDEARVLYENALSVLEERSKVSLVPIDYNLFVECAKLLYEGPWVAERLDANRELMFSDVKDKHLDPTVETILNGSVDHKSYDAFNAFNKLEHFRMQASQLLKDCDCLIHPTVPTLPLLRDDVRNDPIGLNSQNGFYTNHMNLLNMCGLAVPLGIAPDSKLPFGLTISSQSGHDDLLFDVAKRLDEELNIETGAPDLVTYVTTESSSDDHSSIVKEDRIELLVCGGHMKDMALNVQLTSLGAHFVKDVQTHDSYKMLAFEGMSPPRPGIFKSGSSGNSVQCELWSLPKSKLADFLENVKSPLGIGDVELSNGEVVKGFLCQESEAKSMDNVVDITDVACWRTYLDSTK